MLEFYNELQGGNGPVFLKLDHLAEETIQTIETILHTNERPSRGRFHEGRGTDYRAAAWSRCTSRRSACAAATSASGVWVDEHARDHRAGPVRGRRHGLRAAQLHAGRLRLRQVWPARTRPTTAPSTSWPTSTTAQVERERARVCGAAARASDGLPPDAGRIQAAPHGQRLPAAAQGHAQDGDRPGSASRRSATTWTQLQRAQPARADARDGSALHPRLRRDGRARLAVPHREPLGPVPLPRRLPASATTPTGSCTCS